MNAAQITRKFVYLILTVVVVWLMPIGRSVAVINPDTLAGLWLLDDGAGKIVVDTSGNGHDGELVGDLKWAVGRFGQALEFDGDDGMVNTPYISDDQNNAFTISAWIKPSIDIAKQIVVAGRSNGGPQLNLNASGKAMTGFKMNNGQFAHASGTTTFPKGEWTHLAGTYDGSVIKVYVNATQEGELKPANLPGANAFGFQIGAFDESLHGGAYIGQFAPAAIDDIAIFNVALTEEELQSLVDNGLSGALAVTRMGKMAVTWGNLKSNHQ